MAMNGEVNGRIMAIFADKLNVEVSSADTNLLESGALDSLALVELFLQLEREFGIAVDPTDLDIADFQSVASIGSWVSGKQAKARAASG